MKLLYHLFLLCYNKIIRGGFVNLAILYDDKILCEKNGNEIGLINVPHYFRDNSDFSNISIFITLLLEGIMNDDYSTDISGDFGFWDEKFEENFMPECLIQIDKDTYYYDLDEYFYYLNDEKKDKEVKNLPKRLNWKSRDEISKEDIVNDDYQDEETPYSFFGIEKFNQKLFDVLKITSIKRSKKDVLLLYSGGKDSTLAAIRLKKYGYTPHFIHFNNGSMLDSDKPFLTFQETFKYLEGYVFPYEYSDVDIKELFLKYFEAWKQENNNSLLTSEIRCLSCRMAMYTKALEIAKNNNFKIISEGARISQKFFIEQEKFINCIKNIASELGIELIYPVLHLDDDKKLIRCLLDSGFSSKTWESKCLLGEEALDKTEKDEQVIMEYFNNHIRPKMLKYLHIEK